MRFDGAPHGNTGARSAVTDRKETQWEGNGQISFRGEGWGGRGEGREGGSGSP